MPRSIEQTYHTSADIETAFSALLSPGMIQRWWFAKTAIVLPEKGGIYAVTWGEDIDNPDYISVATVSEIEEPERLLLTEFQYHSREGTLPFKADLQLEFTLAKNSSGTAITVRQTGFPEDKAADEFYNSCIQGWTDTMTSFTSVLNGK